MTKQKQENKAEETVAVSVPEKFKNAETGEVKVDSLLKSYLELEKKMSAKPVEKSAPVLPEKPEDYKIEIKSPFMKNDPEINERLFKLGFTNDQVQAVYDLAVEKVIPVIEQMRDAYKSDKDLSELEQNFGGADQFNTVARQISAWGEKNLERSVFEALAGSKEGIMTMYKMMCQAQEPAVLSRNDTEKQPIENEESLKRMMQDPKYWKEQDPELLKRVEAGFKRLYG